MGKIFSETMDIFIIKQKATTMFRFLVDTCVWLDLAKNRDQHVIIRVIEELIKLKKLSLIVPACVLEEFDRNRDRVAKESNQSLSSIFGRVKDTVRKFGDESTKQVVLDQLSNVDFKLPFIGEQSVEVLSQISNLLRRCEIIPLTDEIKLKAAQRAIDKIAPFHRQRNSINDAIIFETYVGYTQTSNSTRNKFAFITHNKHDFSHPSGNEKHPHPQLAVHFSMAKSLYFINLAEALNRINPSLVSDIMVENEDWAFEQRSYSNILEAEAELETKIWYNRHQIRAEKIRTGEIKIISRSELKDANPQTTIVKDIWKGALKSASMVEKKYGKKNLVWDDFEWGMLNGKLSALRWVMGDDWDSLYT